MAKVVGVTPDVLVWARESANLSIDDVARSLKKAPEVVEAWEDPDTDVLPSYGQLEKLAYSLYKRPLAVFFFPERPVEEDVRAEFRLLPDSELAALEPDTLLAAREAYSMQDSLRELTGGRNLAEDLIHRDIHARRTRTLEALVARVRDYLGISLEQQSEWLSTEEAFKGWRSAVEAKGVYVFKRSIKQKTISGFCLTDDEFPVIYINNSTPHSRQIFTLFHELAHLLYAVSGVTKTDTSFVDQLSSTDKALEVKCNRFAGAFLVPDDSFARFLESWDGTEEQIGQIAGIYNVSREVILRKFLDAETIAQKAYEDLVAKWNADYLRQQELKKERQKERGGGGSYYATQATYLGDAYLDLSFGRYYSGACSLDELAGHLNIKAKSVSRLEAYLTGGA